jgi:hypothetical protein
LLTPAPAGVVLNTGFWGYQKIDPKQNQKAGDRWDEKTSGEMNIRIHKKTKNA